LFDAAMRLFAADSRWRGRTSPDYWGLVSPFGGFTAATMLRALTEHPQRAGDPVALTVNFCAPIAEGDFDLDVRLTVTITTYFHADAADLASENTTRLLAVADASRFHKSYSDQAGRLWSPSGRLLATTTQVMFFKA
jgi:acyl-CoA thioesterase